MYHHFLVAATGARQFLDVWHGPGISIKTLGNEKLFSHYYGFSGFCLFFWAR
jgi:hypothetical protein